MTSFSEKGFCFDLLPSSRVHTSDACVDVVVFLFFFCSCNATKDFPCRDERRGAAANNDRPRAVRPASPRRRFVYIILQTNVDPRKMSLFLHRLLWPYVFYLDPIMHLSETPGHII